MGLIPRARDRFGMCFKVVEHLARCSKWKFTALDMVEHLDRCSKFYFMVLGLIPRVGSITVGLFASPIGDAQIYDEFAASRTAFM